MGEEFYFENLDVYKFSSEFVTKIYSITNSFPKDERFGLTNQLRRASVSITSNIAEGNSRGDVEFKRFLDIARGSLFESVCQLKIAQNLDYIDKSHYDSLYTDCVRISKMLMGLKKSLG